MPDLAIALLPLVSEHCDMKQMLLIIALFAACACATVAQSVPAYSADRLMARAANKDTIYIINFWATWCAPCVKELPDFDVLQQRYAGKPVKIILASLDFKEDYPKKLIEFIAKKHPQPEIVWFNETDANSFIPKVDNSWSGALPGTLVLATGHGYRQFMEGTITVQQVSAVVDKQLGL
jgi:thiol-disulfide isomerase/thioredoxin